MADAMITVENPSVGRIADGTVRMASSLESMVELFTKMSVSIEELNKRMEILERLALKAEAEIEKLESEGP